MTIEGPCFADWDEARVDASVLDLLRCWMTLQVLNSARLILPKVLARSSLGSKELNSATYRERLNRPELSSPRANEPSFRI
jgi:hypothetical protein